MLVSGAMIIVGMFWLPGHQVISCKQLFILNTWLTAGYCCRYSQILSDMQCIRGIAIIFIRLHWTSSINSTFQLITQHHVKTAQHYTVQIHICNTSMRRSLCKNCAKYSGPGKSVETWDIWDAGLDRERGNIYCVNYAGNHTNLNIWLGMFNLQKVKDCYLALVGFNWVSIDDIQCVLAYLKYHLQVDQITLSVDSEF